MFRNSSLLFVSLFAVSALSLFARELPEKVSIDPTFPEWVVSVEANQALSIPASGSADGVYYLLSDQQSFPYKNQSFRHFTLRMISAVGVEDYSSVSVNIDPDYQTLIWHRLDIIRDGVRLNQLPHQEFRVSTNQNSDDLIYDNSLECMAIIPGTKKGDILDYAYTVVGSNPITGDRYSRWFALNFSVPIAHIFGRIVRDPQERPLHFRLVSNLPIELALPQAQWIDGKSDTRFERRNVEAIHMDDDTPDTYNAYSSFHVSDWASWQEVSQWGHALYHYKDLEVSRPVELQRAQADWQRLPDDTAKTMAALKWVQEEIRYVGIMIGPHNYKPYTVQETLNRGFGDCKDKTQLLCYLLDTMGIEAHPTLVNTTERGLIGDYLPAAALFDHVITQVKIDGKSYWLDPTNSSQGGSLDTVWHTDYGLGLNLLPQANGLTPVPGQGAEQSKSFVRETLKMQDYNQDIDLTVHSRYTGAEADSMRRYVNRTIPAEIEKEYINFYAQQFPEIKAVAPLEFIDDPIRNIYEVNEHYTLSNAWIPDEEAPATSILETNPTLVRSSMYLSDTRIRTMPAQQAYPQDFTQVIEVILPEPGTFEDEKTQIDTPWFNYAHTVETEGKQLILRYSYKNRSRSIPADDYPEYARQLEKVNETLGYSITYTDRERTATAIETTGHSPHFATYLSAAFSILLALIASAWIVTRQQKPPLPPTNTDADGITGWLGLAAIGLVLSPLIYIAGIADLKDYFNATWVKTYTAPEAPSYIPGFEPLLLCETAFNTFSLILSFTMIYVFFKKRAIMRPLYIVFAITTALFLFADTAITNHLLVSSGYDPLEFGSEGIVASIKAAIWGTYFGISERARNTFRH